MLTTLEKQILKSALKNPDAPPSAWIKLDEIITKIPNTPYDAVCCACCSLHTEGYLDECIRCLDGSMMIHLSLTGAHYHKEHRFEIRRVLASTARKNRH